MTNKELSELKREKGDLSDYDFTDVDVQNLCLNGTNAHIDPQKVKDKSLLGTFLERLDLSNADFTGVNLKFCHLKDTNAHIDPQKVKDKDLSYADLSGLDLSDADFTGVNLNNCNLKDTNAKIDPQKVKNKDLSFTTLTGLDLSDADFTGVNIRFCELSNTNAHIDPQKVKDKDLTFSFLEGLDLSNADFTGVNVTDCNLKDTNANIDFSTIIGKPLSIFSARTFDSQIELTNENISNINYDDVVAITIAKDDAMGEANGFYVVLKNHNLYHTNLAQTKILDEKLLNTFPLLKTFNSIFSNARNQNEDWKSIDMGAGNYLIVRKEYYEVVEQYIKDNLPEDFKRGYLYQTWYEIIKKVVKD